MNRLFVAVGCLLVLSLTPALASAQDATPAVDLVTPDPADCKVQPRTLENLRTFLATPEATPAAPATPATAVASPAVFVAPAGEPADAGTVAGVTATVHEVFACVNGNAFLQVFALYTDDFMARSFVQEGITAEAVELLGTQLEPMPADEWDSVAVRDVQVLADGRVGAYVEGHSSYGEGSDYVQYFIFQEQDGRYLVDEIIFLPAERS